MSSTGPISGIDVCPQLAAAQRIDDVLHCIASQWRYHTVVAEARVPMLQALSAYLFGSRRDAANLPLAREFEGAVMGDMSERLQGIVAEHGAWLRSNCARQAWLRPVCGWPCARGH